VSPATYRLLSSTCATQAFLSLSVTGVLPFDFAGLNDLVPPSLLPIKRSVLCEVMANRAGTTGPPELLDLGHFWDFVICYDALSCVI
jgi:hypothetical protein